MQTCYFQKLKFKNCEINFSGQKEVFFEKFHFFLFFTLKILHILFFTSSITLTRALDKQKLKLMRMPVSGKNTGPPSRNSESPLIPGVMDTSRPPSDLPQGWLTIAAKCYFFSLCFAISFISLSIVLTCAFCT